MACVCLPAALVILMLMTPAVGLFYGGMVRRRNVLGTITQSVWILGFVSVLWALVGYSLAFGPDLGGIIGGLDFAGGTVVHIASGAAATAAALVVGKRKGLATEVMSPHNLPMTVLGAALLWFGWFGFNAGSALDSGWLAASAFVVTHLAAAAATVSWLTAEWLHRGEPTVIVTQGDHLGS